MTIDSAGILNNTKNSELWGFFVFTVLPAMSSLRIEANSMKH